MDDITFNNQPQNLCNGDCEVAVDTGTSMLAGPSDLVDKLSNMVNVKEDCSNFDQLPSIGFQMGDKVLNLKPDDYVDKDAASCSFSLMALDVPPPKGPVFIFGDPFLRRFVTIYDRGQSRVGFAVAKHQEEGYANPNELIATVGAGQAGSNGAQSSPAGMGQPGAVDLHLDSGMMGGAGGGDDSSSDSGDNTEAPPPSTPAPVYHPDDTPDVSDNAVAEALSGPSNDDASPAPVATTTAVPSVAATSGSDANIADAIAPSNDDSTMATPASDSAATSPPAASTTVAPKYDYEAAASAFGDEWFHQGEDASTTAAPVTTTASAYPDLEADYFKNQEVATTPAAVVEDQTQSQDVSTTAAPAASGTLSEVDRMRKMLSASAMLQKSKKGNKNLVSVKLYRSH